MNSQPKSETGFFQIGRRIHVIGNSASGKSTLAERLALLLDADFVELDALNWLPNWVGLNETDPEELLSRFKEATRGDRWVVAGSYTQLSKEAFWSRLDTVIWLDLPVYVLIWRVLRRSWKRWRSNELLWGTNVERFWPHLAVWRGEDSLVYWILSAQRRKRNAMLSTITDPIWKEIGFVCLTSAREIEEFVEKLEAAPKP